MGAYNGAEVCELIGVLMLLLLSKHINKNSIGLYSNDGLTILKNTSGPEAEKPLKKFHDQFKKRLSVLSSPKNIFQESTIYYKKCIKNSGYKNKLQYQKPKENNQNKKKRKRNIIWSNPLYSKSVKTNIGEIFIKLISKHLPPNHKFGKIFDKNTIKT